MSLETSPSLPSVWTVSADFGASGGKVTRAELESRVIQGEKMGRKRRAVGGQEGWGEGTQQRESTDRLAATMSAGAPQGGATAWRSAW